MKNVINVDYCQLEQMFNELNGSPFVHVKMDTQFTDDLLKSKIDSSVNPYYRQIRKYSERTFKIVRDYEKRVKVNLVREGKDPSTFKVESPKGKKHLSDCILTDLKTETKRYLMIEWFEGVKGRYNFTFQGNPIEKVIFEKWITQREKTNGKQGLENGVTPITVLFDSLVEVSVNGVIYRVIHPMEVVEVVEVV